MGVITHRPWPEDMLQVRGQRLLKASSDALSLPAPAGPAVLTSAHHPRAFARACGHTGVSLAEHAWACVGMRGHAWARARSTRACDAACLYSCEGHSRAKHRPRYQPASDYTQRTTGASFSSGARRWSMRMGAWRGRTSICVCLISLSTRSAQSRQAGERLGWCPHIECHLPRGPAGHLLMM